MFRPRCALHRCSCLHSPAMLSSLLVLGPHPKCTSRHVFSTRCRAAFFRVRYNSFFLRCMRLSALRWRPRPLRHACCRQPSSGRGTVSSTKSVCPMHCKSTDAAPRRLSVMILRGPDIAQVASLSLSSVHLPVSGVNAHIARSEGRYRLRGILPRRKV